MDNNISYGGDVKNYCIISRLSIPHILEEHEEYRMCFCAPLNSTAERRSHDGILMLAYESGITDNRIEGIFASAPAGAEANIYVGRSAGLIMSNVHVYGTPAKHIILRSTAHTIVSNAYIEGGYTNTGIDARILRTLTVNNTIIVASNPNTIMFSAIDLGSETPGFRYVSLNGVTFESYEDLGIESVTPIILGTGCVATGSNLTINDIYNAIEDVDPNTGLTAIRLI